jgi:hypothetical protein
MAALAEARHTFEVDSSAAAVGEYAGKRGELRKAWPSLTLDRQRVIVQALIKRVDVQPASGRRGGRNCNPFDPSRVSAPIWR